MVHIDKHIATEVAIHSLTLDASDLGLKPGEWPQHLSTDLGNGQDFVRDGVILHADEFAGYCYVQANGCLVLNVYND